MSYKKLIALTNKDFVNRITIKNLPTETVELAEEDLQQIIGGNLLEIEIGQSSSGKSNAFGGTLFVSLPPPLPSQFPSL